MTTDEPTSEERYQRLSISPVTRDSIVDSLKMRPANADLSIDDVHYSSGDATELLNDASSLLLSWRAELLAEADRPALTASVEEWLKRFEELGR